MNFTGFTQSELIPYIGTLILSLGILIRNFWMGYQQFWSPLTLIVIVFGYYCLLGPYEAITTGNTYDRLIDMRPYYVSSFWGAFISLLSCVLGFLAYNGRPKKIFYNSYLMDESLMYYGKRVFIIGFILFTISTKGNVLKLVNPLNAESVEQVGGSFANYFGLSVNFFVPGVALLLAYYLRTKKGLWWVIGCFVLAFALYTTLGFRWRLVMLFGSLAITYYFIVKKRPNIIVGSVAIVGFILFMGILNITRNYGRGLNLSRLDNKNTSSYYKSGLSEAKIFQTSGAIIDIVPDKYPFVGFEPIISALLFPIPRAIFPQKGSAEYLFNALRTIYGNVHGKGAAIMMYGEHYLAFGWMGIIIGGFLIGWFYKKLWVWYLANADNPFVIATYAVTVTYLYVILSRGYLPQVTMLFFFTVYPAFVVFNSIKKKFTPSVTKRFVSSAN